MSDFVECVVIGAGVVGLAIARKLAKSGRDVVILEKNHHFGEETSSRNSEVIHAGIYYPKDSLKAKLCVAGKKMLYQYCDAHGVAYKNLGKLIVATNEDEISTLEQIKAKAEDNSVNDLKWLTKEEVFGLEPHLKCEKALLSPSTGIIDTHQYMLSLVGEIEANGGAIAYDTPFEAATICNDGFEVTAGGHTLKCRQLINSAGLFAQDVASNIKGLAEQFIPPRYLAKGNYFTMNAASPFKRLIYPVPQSASLGVHVTLDMAGQIRFGPDQEWVKELDYEVNPARGNSFYDAIRKYWPDLPDNSLIPAYSGIRPKIQSPTDPHMDFRIEGSDIHGIKGLVNLFGIESPGLTSSLAIAREVIGKI
ncbi:FAD-dependent oxidoreductase [Sneathiella sp. P13V-1]|uniref:NAD(P)/FAD-dependent oxidoreductase n=1 Tax=Sneathiella sp. P13V-1 TaxID=2697366 RepID=UPI00187B3639|nr:NAD(P)/FAD-dependent oxidoreductase [Sneathiella sp. P13V-1]MBE7636831.1 FAD-dependent oxidoreductase [Sneathiella sp. P13V-1]